MTTLFLLLFLNCVLFMGDVCSMKDGRKVPKCKNPKGKLWSSVMDEECGVSVCKRKGQQSAEWKACPRAATEERLDILAETMKTDTEAVLDVLKSQTEKLQQIDELVRMETNKVEEKVEDVCGCQQTQTTQSNPASPSPSPPRQKNLMYSWATTWSGDCGQEEFLSWDEKKNPECFTNPWDTKNKREKLWCACNRPGREIGTLLLYGIGEMTKAAMEGSSKCESDDISLIRSTMAEGHSAVENLQIYALLSWGGKTVPEQDLVPSLVWYNQECAQNNMERLDGVAVNNEDFDKYGSQQEKLEYLENLSKIAVNAGSELKTHYSVGWHWFTGGNLTFNGATKNVLMHMIDIFDSIDVQTAYIRGHIMVDRLQKDLNGQQSTPPAPEGLTVWSYSQSQGKVLYTTLYLNKAPGTSLSDCRTHFFPMPGCDGVGGWDVLPYQTEDRMWEEVDSAKKLLPGFTPSLHFYGGAYSSGGHQDWPDFCN